MNDQRHRLLAGAPPVTPKPEREYRPTEIATAWRLTKRGRCATCRIVAHPLGVELRVDVDGDVLRTEVVRELPRAGELPRAALMLAAEWRERWIAKGWTQPDADTTQR